MNAHHHDLTHAFNAIYELPHFVKNLPHRDINVVEILYEHLKICADTKRGTISSNYQDANVFTNLYFTTKATKFADKRQGEGV